MEFKVDDRVIVHNSQPARVSHSIPTGSIGTIAEIKHWSIQGLLYRIVPDDTHFIPQWVHPDDLELVVTEEEVAQAIQSILQVRRQP